MDRFFAKEDALEVYIICGLDSKKFRIIRAHIKSFYILKHSFEISNESRKDLNYKCRNG